MLLKLINPLVQFLEDIFKTLLEAQWTQAID